MLSTLEAPKFHNYPYIDQDVASLRCEVSRKAACEHESCRGFPESSAEPPSSAPESGHPVQGDPFLQRLIGSGSQQDKFIKERLEEMSDDATDVSLFFPHISLVQARPCTERSP